MSSSKPKKVKTTTTSQPPEYLRGPMQGAANAAYQNYIRDEGEINPYTSLDNQFNRAADLTRTRLDSEFAGSGRNLGAAQPARSDELQTLAARIYDPMNIKQFDPLNMLIERLGRLGPYAGGTTEGQQPFFKSGLF